jgi:putrescine transport system substrate-binding protein
MRISSKWRLVRGVLATLGVVGLAGSATAADKDVRIFFWYDYVSPDVIADFEKSENTKLVYDTFENVEMVSTKLLTGKSGYDITMPGGSTIAKLIKAGALQKLDKSKLNFLADLSPEIMSGLAGEDPGNDYAIPYAYGTTGVIYNAAKVAERLPDAPVNSLDIVFKPELISKFADCGVAFADTPEGIMSVALNYLGLEPFSTKPEDIEKAAALLNTVRPHIKHFKTGSIISEMAEGDLCLALGWSGDGYIAAGRAAEAKKGVEVKYSIPKEGTELFSDLMVIPKDAPNTDGAYKLMNHLMAPANIAKFTTAFQYPNANLKATELVDEAIRSDPNIYPPKDVMAKIFAARPRDDKSLRLVTRAWTTFITGVKK